MIREELKNKDDVRNYIEDFLSGFTENSLFDINIQKESRISINMPYTNE